MRWYVGVSKAGNLVVEPSEREFNDLVTAGFLAESGDSHAQYEIAIGRVPRLMAAGNCN